MQWYLRKIVVHVIAYGTLGYRYAITCVNMKHANERVCSQQRNATDNMDSQQRKRQKTSSVEDYFAVCG
jgi:hypothetical protein